MKKVLPFIFPLVALVIVIFLAYRWYNLNTANRGQINQMGEGVEIENLSDNEKNSVMKGTGDFKKAELKGSSEAQGDIRYDLKDGKVRFSVNADLPASSSGRYQVWIKNGDKPAQKAFVLEQTKGGFTGSAAVSDTALPLDVIVTNETKDDETMETVVLQGTVKKESN